jgi:hypothetical protein
MIMPPEVEPPKSALKRPFPNRRSFSSLALPTALTLLAIIYMGPWYPEMPAASLDSSWKMVVQYAFDHSWQFGTDIIFTFGPLGFLSSGLFDPESYKWLVLLWTFHAVLLVATLSALAPRGSAKLLVATVLLAVAGGAVFHHDAYVIMSPFMLLVLYTTRPDSKWLIFGWSVFLAVLALSKFTIFPAALPILFLIALTDLLRFRRLPLSLLSFTLSFFVLYRVSGQRFASLQPFFASVWDISSGYSHAMHVRGPASEIFAFALIAVALLLCVLIVEVRRARDEHHWLAAVSLMLALLLSVFVSFKSGFVRHDGHSLIAWGGLILASTVLAGRAKLVSGKSSASVAIVAIGFISFGLTLAAFHHHLRFFPSQSFSPSYLWTRSTGAAHTVFTWNAHLQLLEQQHQAALANIRAQHPLGHIDGTVDVFDINQAVVIAANLDYKPRPVFQSYSAYTAPLIRRNLEFFESANRPQNVLLQLVPVDYRLPSLEGGPVWLRLINDYDLLGSRAEFLLLHQRRHPGDLALSRLSQISSKPGDIIPVPQIEAPLFVRITLRNNLAGKLISALFRESFVYIDTQLAPGQWRSQRFIPSMASEGFLLSPLIDDTADFAALLAHPQHPEHRPEKSPSAIRISLGRTGSRLFDKNMTVEFYRVGFSTSAAEHELQHAVAGR